MGTPKNPKKSLKQQRLEASDFLSRGFSGQVEKKPETPEKPAQEEIAYHIDHTGEDQGQIPSLTKLLNRKKLTLKKEPFPEPSEVVESDLAGEMTQASLERSILHEQPVDTASDPQPESELEFEPPAQGPTPAPSAPVPIPAGVRLTARTGRSKAAQPLLVWDREQLKKAKDPLGQALTLLFQKGAESCLFLCLSPPPTGKRVPEFIGTALSGDKARRGLWTGLRWTPDLFPELWNSFVRNGHLELAPPSAATNQLSQRNLIRAAFGLQQDEYLLLLRAGPADACRGVVAIVSRKSLVGSIGPAIKLMSQKIAAKARSASRSKAA